MAFRKGSETDGFQERKREANYALREKYLLVKLVEMHFEIIENKGTDETSSKQKMEAWEVISNNFNCESEFHIQRSSASLKSQWKNLKEKAKILETIDRPNILETGSGPPLRDNLNIRNSERILLERVSALLGQTSTGVLNIFDSDGADQPQYQCQEVEEDNSEVLRCGNSSHSKNYELANAKIQTISLANEQASEIHSIVVQTHKEKLKQECLKTAILEEELIMIRHKRKETIVKDRRMYY